MAVATEASLLDCEMSIKTVRLEKEYEKALADSARLLDAEKDRMRRMEQLLFQFESDALRSQLDQANEQLLGFAQTESGARLQLDEAYQEIDRLNLHVQASSNEIERLKGELSTLKNTSTGYNALLTEKLHLSRDLSNLRSENERLKSQNSAHQALVAEKHEMERQLNSLEVQLQNEKHAHERTRAKGSQQAEEVDKLYSRIDELQGELTRDLRAKQQHERDNRQQITGWDSQRAVLEGKIEMLKKQLRSTKDKLQETQHDLQQRRSNLKHHEADHAESRSRVIPLQRSGPSAEYHSGVTIATPGAVRVKEKAKRQSALPGDKSAFSITPFLNRTGAPRDSVSSSEEEENEMDLTMDDSHASLRKVRAVDELSEVDSVPKDGPGATRAPPPKFGKAKAREGKPSISRPVNGVQQPASRLDRKVSQDESEELRDPTIEQEQAKPKKRKLGAQRDRNLFEDEDEEELFESRKPGRKLALGAARNSVLATTTAPPATSTALNRTLGLGAPMGFSPLKRDRKRF